MSASRVTVATLTWRRLNGGDIVADGKVIVREEPRLRRTQHWHHVTKRSGGRAPGSGLFTDVAVSRVLDGGGNGQWSPPYRRPPHGQAKNVCRANDWRDRCDVIVGGTEHGMLVFSPPRVHQMSPHSGGEERATADGLNAKRCGDNCQRRSKW